MKKWFLDTEDGLIPLEEILAPLSPAAREAIIDAFDELEALRASLNEVCRVASA